eukprot:Gb_37106 [translate_table: standard]
MYGDVRAEEVGFVVPTDVQEQALPVLLSGCDCIIHAQVVNTPNSLHRVSSFLLKQVFPATVEVVRAIFCSVTCHKLSANNNIRVLSTFKVSLTQGQMNSRTEFDLAEATGPG